MAKELDLNDAYKIAAFIKESKKSTKIKAYVDGDLYGLTPPNICMFGSGSLWILFGESIEISKFLDENNKKINKYEIEFDRRNSAIPLLDIRNIEARIEPGSIIRDKVKIGKNAVIMMGAVINIGAEIGENTMIDMNAVLGARVMVGKDCHIGAGSVLAGVLEPPSATPVIIEDNVLIGANAVILEGIKIGKGSVVAAGSVVTKDVPHGKVVAGIPARLLKDVSEMPKDKNKLLDDLRG